LNGKQPANEPHRNNINWNVGYMTVKSQIVQNIFCIQYEYERDSIMIVIVVVDVIAFECEIVAE
jgi:hypothetical protein